MSNYTAFWTEGSSNTSWCNLDTSSVMDPESSCVLGLWSSDTHLWATQPGVCYTMNHPSWSTAILMLLQQHQWCFRLLFSPAALWLQGGWGTDAETVLRSPCSTFRLYSSVSSRYLAFLHSWASSISGPGFWVPLFSSSDEDDVPPGVELVFAQLNACANGVCYCLQHLVMVPPVPPLSQGFRAAAQDVLQGRYLPIWSSGTRTGVFVHPGIIGGSRDIYQRLQERGDELNYFWQPLLGCSERAWHWSSSAWLCRLCCLKKHLMH